MSLLAPLLVALGFIVRDGWPPTGSTFLARALGSVPVLVGATFANPTGYGFLTGLALAAGFWVDQKHGEGQRARDWRDAKYLALSGLTSLLPAAALSLWLDPSVSLALLLAAVAKPGIWFAAWRVSLPWPPTRVAAGVFGALVGVALLLPVPAAAPLPRAS